VEPIKVNLATFEYFDKRIVYSLILGAAIFVLMISAFNLQRSFRYQNEIFDYEGKIKRLDQMLVKRQPIGGENVRPVGKEALKEMEEAVLHVNRLIAADLFPWGRVFDLLEKEIPDPVALHGFLPSEDFSRLTLRGQSRSMADVSLFLGRLESSRLFERAVLAKLTVPEGKLEPQTEKLFFEINAFLNMRELLNEEPSGPKALLHGEAKGP
jgi:hypothetical protein